MTQQQTETAVDIRRRERSPEEGAMYLYASLAGIVGYLVGLPFFYIFDFLAESSTGKFLVTQIPLQIMAFGSAMLCLAWRKCKAGWKPSWGELLEWSPDLLRGSDAPGKKLYWWEFLERSTSRSGRQRGALGWIYCYVQMFALLVAGVFVLNNLLGPLVVRWLGLSEPSQAIVAYATADVGLGYWIVTGFCTVILGPLAEEILFRQVVFRCIQRGVGHWAVHFTAVFFALMHGLPHAFLALTFTGYMLQWCRRRMGLRGAFVIHSLYNLLNFILLVCRWGEG